MRFELAAIDRVLDAASDRLLARWLVFFVREAKLPLRQLSDEQVIAYLERRDEPADGALR